MLDPGRRVRVVLVERLVLEQCLREFVTADRRLAEAASKAELIA